MLDLRAATASTTIDVGHTPNKAVQRTGWASTVGSDFSYWRCPISGRERVRLCEVEFSTFSAVRPRLVTIRGSVDESVWFNLSGEDVPIPESGVIRIPVSSAPTVVIKVDMKGFQGATSLSQR